MAATANQIPEKARALFPYFQDKENSSWAFFENAGGSQVPKTVIDAVSNYFSHSYAQLGAGYPASDRATATVDDARRFLRDVVFNGADAGECMMGHSTSMLLQTLGNAYETILKPDDEVIVMEMAHESNFGPWIRLCEKTGAKLKQWKADPKNGFLSTISQLEEIVSPRTKLVAITHVSNVLGDVVDVRAAVDLVRRVAGHRARVIVDGVAYAPHRAIDVKDLGVDFYVFSVYKVYGPHMAAMFGTHDAFKELEGRGLNHFFVPHTAVPYKFELGGVCHESCAAVLGIEQYILQLLGKTGYDKASRADWEDAFNLMSAAERPLQARLVEYLASKSSVLLLGSNDPHCPTRVPTISFIHDKVSPADVVAALHGAKIACRNGHMYARRVIDAMYPSNEDAHKREAEWGVVRLSMVHYNTLDEVERCIQALEKVL